MLAQQAERRLIFILAAIQFAHILDFTMMMPLGPQLIRALHLTAQQFGWLISSYTFAAAISALIAAKILDRIDRKRALVGFFIVFLASTVACGRAATLTELLLARSLAGASGGVLNGILLAIIGDSVAMERRGKAVGTVMSSFAVASVAGIPLALYVSRGLGWGAPFIALGGIGLVILLGLLRWVPVAPPRTGPLAGLKNHSQMPMSSMATGLMATFFLMVAGFSVVPYVSTSLVANAAVRQDKLFLVYLVAGSVVFFTSRLFGKVSDLYDKFRVFLAVGAASMLSTLLITHLGAVGLWPAVVVTTLFMALNSGRIVPLLSLLVTKVPGDLRGRFMALNASTQQLASGVGAALSGHLVLLDDHGALRGFDRVGWLSLGALVVAMLFLGIFDSNQRRLAGNAASAGPTSPPRPAALAASATAGGRDGPAVPQPSRS